MEVITSPQGAGRNNSACIYGESRTGKTNVLGGLALDLFERTGQRTRLITSDGGGWEPIQDLIDVGIIEAVSLVADDDFVVHLRSLSDGAWPKDPNDIRGKWYAPKDNPTLGIGLICVESIASIAGEVMNYFVEKNIKLNEAVVGHQTLKAEDGSGLAVKIGQSARGHYGVVGGEIFRLISNFQKLITTQNLERLVFTSLEASGDEKVAGMTKQQLGVAAIGKAITAQLPQKFGDLIHLERVGSANEKTKQLSVEYRAYFQNHADAELSVGNLVRTWPASLRLNAEQMVQLDKHPEYSKGYVTLKPEGDPLAIRGVANLFNWRREISELGNKTKLASLVASKETK